MREEQQRIVILNHVAPSISWKQNARMPTNELPSMGFLLSLQTPHSLETRILKSARCYIGGGVWSITLPGNRLHASKSACGRSHSDINRVQIIQGS